MGAAKKPTHLKTIQGTNRPSRENPAEPTVEIGGLIAPDYLTEIQAERFAELAETVVGVLCVAGRSDSHALAQLAIALDAIGIDNILIADVGPYITRASGDVVAHPATRRIVANQQRAQALMSVFGLTPADRSRVSAGPKETKNPFAALNGKRA